MKDKYIRATTGPFITSAKTDTQYKFTETEDTLTISIQGSVSRLDWLYNFMVLPYKHMERKFFVHYGFLRKWRDISGNVMYKAKEARDLGKKIEVLAFSQGAAVGWLAIEAIVYELNYHPKSYLFGSPKVFSIFGRRILTARLSHVNRVVNGNDFVTKLLWFLFRHYGKLIHIGRKRKWYKFSFRDHTHYKESL